MTDEEKKAKRAAYMVQWRQNLSRFQKEKRRLQNSQYRKKLRTEWTPEQLEKSRELNRIYYAKNKEKLLANMAIYRENKKKRIMITENEKQKLIKDAATIFVAAGGIATLGYAIYFIFDLIKKWY
jgi:hypothetical protein